jgi:hypothetical protein
VGASWTGTVIVGSDVPGARGSGALPVPGLYVQLTLGPVLAEQSQPVPEGVPLTSKPLGTVAVTTGGEFSARPLGSTVAPSSSENDGELIWTDPLSESEMDASSSGVVAIKVTASLAEAKPNESSEDAYAVLVCTSPERPEVTSAGTVTGVRASPGPTPGDGE